MLFTDRKHRRKQKHSTEVMELRIENENLREALNDTKQQAEWHRRQILTLKKQNDQLSQKAQHQMVLEEENKAYKTRIQELENELDEVVGKR